MIKVLEGVRVIEQGTFITGPNAGMLLADLGAEVIKVEKPGSGDPFRAFKGGLYSPHFQTYNRNKRSVTLNTKEPEDLALFDQLIADADVYIQNFRPVPPSGWAPARSACAPSTPGSSTARSAASVRTVRPPAARPTTPWPRPPAAS
ncbi:Succinyl-CoA--L-malate CoA-transferase alpha subunit [Alcanivorax sp. ALC70]|nr:Succinyl-CoA--L-malate CoA-transferase alpha subunit [Alcanivorax sp. ALC70]